MSWPAKHREWEMREVSDGLTAWMAGQFGGVPQVRMTERQRRRADVWGTVYLLDRAYTFAQVAAMSKMDVFTAITRHTYGAQLRAMMEEPQVSPLFALLEKSA